jgi:hypothetical protein
VTVDATPSPLVHRTVRHGITVRHLTVGAVRPLTSRLVRITLTGPDLAGFAAEGPADHVKLLFPDPATGEIATPFAPDGSRVPPTGPVIARDYTPLAFRADAGDGGELDVDFVLHGDEGPASAWAARRSATRWPSRARAARTWCRTAWSTWCSWWTRPPSPPPPAGCASRRPPSPRPCC